MDKISRGEALDKMLLGIYGNRNVNFENQKVIINDDRIKKTLYSPTSINNVRRLLEVTFKETDVKFEDKKEGKSFDLDREKVIDNTTIYFRSFGIDIPNVVNKTEKKLLGKRMCNALIEYILPAIFCNLDTKKEKFEIEADDVSFKFNKAVEQIKKDFSTRDFFEQLYVDIQASDVERLYDSEFSENECNYGVLICVACQRNVENLNVVPSVYYYECNNNKHETESIEHRNDKFSELTSKLVRTATLDIENFVSPYYYNPKSVNDSPTRETPPNDHKINFNADVPNPNFIPRYVYFMTRIDEDIIANSFPDCKSPDELEQKLILKAIEQLRIKYTDEFIRYYKNTFSNIEEVCKGFLRIDIETILNQQITDIRDFKEALSSLCNESDIDSVWKFCEEKGLSAQQASRCIYCGIEEAMRDFLFSIQDLLMRDCKIEIDSDITTIVGSDGKLCKRIPNWIGKPRLLISIENYIPKSVITKHTSTLVKILGDEKIDELCKIRDKYSSYTWNPSAGLKIRFGNDSDYFLKNPKFYNQGDTSSETNGYEDGIKDNIYTIFKKVIADYCSCLND